MKKKVKEERRIDLAHVDPAGLTVWKTKGAIVTNKLTSKRLAETLRSINIDDEDTIEELSECEEVAGLGLSNGQILLVQRPPVKLDGVVDLSEVDREYEDLFLQASTKGNFKEEDIDSNGIVDASMDKAPEFVQKHE